MEQKNDNTKKASTQKELKDELEKMLPEQAVNNLKNFLNFALRKGIVDDIDKAIILEKSIDVLQQASLLKNEEVMPPAPLETPAGMAPSTNEKQEMIN